MADATYQPLVYRKQGGDELVVASGGKINIESGGTIEAAGVDLIDELAALNGLDSTELGYLNGVSAGTVLASKAVVTTTDKHIDALVISDGGLALGAGAGTAVTSTAAELNLLDGVSAGVLTASKAVIANSAGAISNTGSHLAINSFLTATDSTGDTVRINSITNTGTANSLIGFQAKPGQGAATAQNIIGCEISPRVNDTFALTGSGSLIGAHVDAYLKGTTGDIAGDVRGVNIEVVTDDAGARTVSGNVSMLRFRAAFSATAITGTFVPIRIEKAETQTNSQQFDAVLELPSTNAGVWNDAPGTEPTTADGYIKVLVNGNARYIQLYSGAPAD